MEIRPARATDAQMLAAMRWAFRSEMDTPTEAADVFTTRMKVWLHDRMVSGQWNAWVAVDGNEIVGTLFVQLVDKLPNPVVEPELLG